MHATLPSVDAGTEALAALSAAAHPDDLLCLQVSKLLIIILFTPDTNV